MSRPSEDSTTDCFRDLGGECWHECCVCKICWAAPVTKEETYPRGSWAALTLNMYQWPIISHNGLIQRWDSDLRLRHRNNPSIVLFVNVNVQAHILEDRGCRHWLFHTWGGDLGKEINFRFRNGSNSGLPFEEGSRKSDHFSRPCCYLSSFMKLFPWGVISRREKRTQKLYIDVVLRLCWL